MRLIVCRFVSAASGGRVGRSEKEEKSGSRRGASLCEPREWWRCEPGSGDADDVGGVGPVLSVRDFKVDHVALLQRAIAVASEGRIVNGGGLAGLRVGGGGGGGGGGTTSLVRSL